VVVEDCVPTFRVGARNDEFTIIYGKIRPDILGEISTHTTIVISSGNANLIILLAVNTRIVNKHAWLTLNAEIVFEFKCHELVPFWVGFFGQDFVTDVTIKATRIVAFKIHLMVVTIVVRMIVQFFCQVFSAITAEKPFWGSGIFPFMLFAVARVVRGGASLIG